VEHLGVGLQVGVADLAVQLDNLLQLGDCSIPRGHICDTKAWPLSTVIEKSWLPAAATA
jgi:hypothetical protein